MSEKLGGSMCTKQRKGTGNLGLPWRGNDYITAPCDNEACQHKDTSRNGCSLHSRHMVSMCEDYVPEKIESVYWEA